ncbi:hypothetical protein ZOSMA_96G00330 [Zostera marina]|uniref:F-box domain-containing protein n=1 Tax=Zostera marina TaxID=29655 RepID=A0A0K9NHX4_ZOSMR|nr:hypothetical protein ZOSMA_96G00330 [Zostera marina]
MSNEDVISSLPDDIVDKILVCLLLSEAISTSFLSRRWRYKWRSISEININEYDDFFLSTDITAKLDQLLLLHTGDIQKFSCQFRYEFVLDSQ